MGQYQKQSGAVSLLVTCVLGAIAIMILSFSAIASKQAVLSYDDQLKADLDLAIQELQTWYEKNADFITASNLNPSEEQLLSVLSNPKAGLRAAISTSMATGPCNLQAASITCIPWRKIAVWYPASSPVSSSLVQDGIPVGQFTSDSMWRSYSSQSWYYNRYHAQSKKLQDVGRALMSWFKGQAALNPDTGSTINFWRSADCSVASVGLSCIDFYTNILNTTVPVALGFSSPELATVLGGNIEISNLQDSSIVPPYSISLRVPMPWGQYMKSTVVQP